MTCIIINKTYSKKRRVTTYGKKRSVAGWWTYRVSLCVKNIGFKGVVIPLIILSLIILSLLYWQRISVSQNKCWMVLYKNGWRHTSLRLSSDSVIIFKQITPALYSRLEYSRLQGRSTSSSSRGSLKGSPLTGTSLSSTLLWKHQCTCFTFVLSWDYS